VKKLLLVTAAFVAAVAVFVWFTAPPRRLALAATSDGTIPGIVHVHTNRSDGLSGPDEIAAAAARAGLRFVVFTDHGDGTRRPDPPQYRSGVLCLDGVEISTSGGHYVVIDMPASPYPLAGDPRDVVEDVRRMGGFGIAAHPDSPKAELRWRDWTAPVDGLELLNPDSAWRLWVEQARRSATRWPARRRLFATLVDYPFRPTEVIASLIQTSRASSDWEALTRRRRVVAIAGVDAHAKLPLSDDERIALPVPGYDPAFRVLSVHVRTDRALTGSGAADAAVVIRAIRGGHLYTAVDGVATPPSFEFTATNDRGTVHEGDQLDVGGAVTLRVRSNAPPSFTATVWRGATVMSTDHHEQEFSVQAPAEPAVYWVEIRATGRDRAWGAASAVPPLAWIRSNAIYVRGTEPPAPVAARPPATVKVPIFDGRSAVGWRVEHDPSSLVAVEPTLIVGGADLRFRYGLAGGAPGGQVAALAYDTPRGVSDHDRLTVSIRAEHAMRVSVQLRGAEDQTQPSRWQRSIYVDPIQQERTVYFDDLMPMGDTRAAKPDLAAIRSILLVVDANNTKPGDSGRIWIRKAELQR